MKVLGWRGLSLLVPSVASAVGFFCFAVLAFSFTELQVLPQWFRTGLVLCGSFSLAFGSEVGTLSNVIEIYRKGDSKQIWDWIALVISVMSTFVGVVLAFATLLGAKAMWSSFVQVWTPIALGLLAALDSYGNFLEFGLYLARMDATKNIVESRLSSKQKRMSVLLELLKNNGRITVSDIAKQLDVSEPTVYNYLNELEKANKITKINGEVLVNET
jgi:DNA-binding CsgD family transcriptional regulator